MSVEYCEAHSHADNTEKIILFIFDRAFMVRCRVTEIVSVKYIPLSGHTQT